MVEPSRNQIANAVEVFINAQMWNDCKSIFEEYHDLLLTADADLVLANMLERQKDDTNATYRLEERRELLARCRREGIGGILAYYIHTDESLKPLLNEIIKLRSPNDLSHRIELCRTALQIVNRNTQTRLWVYLQNDLAKILVQNSEREHTDNIEQAIFRCEQVLEVRTRQAFPADWAMAQHNLGNAYYKRTPGERADNLEQAISHYELALEVRTRQAFPADWAATQHNLGNAYLDRIRKEHVDNLEQAISHYELALEVYTRQAFPENWAATQHYLGNAYLNRIRGERADNLEQAISHCKQALEVYTRQAFPENWAKTQSYIGNAYSNRILGERAENLEQAIHYYQQALEIDTRQASPENWAATQNDLGGAYYKRIHGERAENLELAISHFAQGLEVITHQTYPEEWAIMQDNLATTYQDRIRGERADNLEQAISRLEQALKVRDETALEVRMHQAFPEDWATTQNNLGNAYLYRIRGERTENVEQAISHYEQALKVRTRRAFPEDWAATQNNLALAYQYRIRGEHADNLEQAIYYYEQALEISTHQAFPEDWARAQNNLALAYRMRVRGEQAENLEQAILHYQQALEVFTPMTFPQKCRDTAYSLGCLLYDEHRFLEARHALSTAHQAVEVLRGEVQRDIAKRSVAEENADLYARLVSCCLREEDEDAAFTYAVAGKGRAFVDLLATARFDLSAASANDPALADDLRKARELRQQIDALLATLTGESGSSLAGSSPTVVREISSHSSLPPDVLRAQLSALQAQEAHHWDEMAYKYPALTATKKTPVLSADQAPALAAELNATLVEYYRHAEGWCAFVVTANAMHHIPLPRITDDLLERMVNWMQRIDYPALRNQLSVLRLSEWYDAVIAPLEAHLTNQQPVVLAPFGQLHVLPMAVARHPKTGRYITEDYLLAFAPSLSALYAVLNQTHRRDDNAIPHRLLSVAYPGAASSDHYLPNVLLEAEAIARHFTQVTTLYQEDATPDKVLMLSHDQDMVHFGCHGWFDAEQPEESGLMLAGGWLTVQRIITELRLEQTHLATLGSCLSGRAALQRGDEYVGLLQAMLTTGVQAVVASLWSVDDAATRALFESFYAELVAGHSPAKALQEAARLVREQSGWAHPYYWAAFQVSGLAHGG